MLNRKLKNIDFHNKRTAFIISIVFNLFVFFALILFFVPKFESSDDNYLLMFTNSSFGHYDTHMIYANRIIGVILSALYKTAYSVPWYALFHYSVAVISLVTITYFTLMKIEGNLLRWAFAALLVYSSYQFYVIPQYTKTAMVATIAGVICVCESLTKDKFLCRTAILGGILLVIGYLIRDISFFAAGLTMTPIIIKPIIVFCKNHNIKEIRKRVFSGIIMVVVISICIGSFKIYDDYNYKSKDWQYYREYNSLRTDLMDFGWPDYEKNKDLYSSLKIDETAYKLYSSWDFNDPEKFNLEAMRKLVDSKPSTTLAFSRFIELLYENLPAMPLFYFVIFEILVICFNIKKLDLTDKLTCVASVILLSVEIIYLAYSGRVFVNRFDFGLWFATSIVILYTISHLPNTIKRMYLAVAFFVVFSVMVFFKRDSMTTLRISKDERITIQNEISTLVSDDEHFYFYHTTLGLVNNYKTFDSFPENWSNNILPLGNWDTNTPLQKEILNNHNITNPYRALLENEDCLLIARPGSAEMILDYIHKWYDSEAEAVLVQKYTDWNVYSINSTDKYKTKG